MQSLLRDQDTLERGIERGIEQGESKKVIEMAKSLLKDQLPLEFISKHTGLSLGEIEQLDEEFYDENSVK